MMPDFDTEAAELETAGFEKKKFVGIFSRARAAHDREFRVDVLALRYGIPALLVSLVGIVEFEVLAHHPPEKWTHEVCVGAEFALAGAYTYVLLYLGQRSLRRDLTSGAAVWAAVTMTLGPILGGVLALLWKPTTDTNVSWSFNAISLRGWALPPIRRVRRGGGRPAPVAHTDQRDPRVRRGRYADDGAGNHARD